MGAQNCRQFLPGSLALVSLGLLSGCWVRAFPCNRTGRRRQ